MPDELQLIDAYWRAANYLSVGQIYLLDNPLLREPLRAEHIKPRLLGTGYRPRLNSSTRHLNRIIRERDLNVIYVTGPGHGGSGLVASTYLGGHLREVYLRSVTTPKAYDDCSAVHSRRHPSHVAAETPGSINEGGELGYSLLHAYGQCSTARSDRGLCGRRRRSEDGPLAALAFERVPDPPRRRRAAGPASERATRSPTDRAGPDRRGRAPGVRSTAMAMRLDFCPARIRHDASGDGGNAGGGGRRDRIDPAPGPGEAGLRAP